MLVEKERVCLWLRQILEMGFYCFRVWMIGPKSFQESVGALGKLLGAFGLGGKHAETASNGGRP